MPTRRQRLAQLQKQRKALDSKINQLAGRVRNKPKPAPQPMRPNFPPPQEPRPNWKGIIILGVAAGALLTLAVGTLYFKGSQTQKEVNPDTNASDAQFIRNYPLPH